MSDKSTLPADTGGTEAGESSTTGQTEDRTGLSGLFRRGFLSALAAVAGGAVTNGVAGQPDAQTSTDAVSPDHTSISRRVLNEFLTRIKYSNRHLLRDDGLRLLRGDSVGASVDSSVRLSVPGDSTTAVTPSHPSNDRLSEDAVVVKFGKSLAHDDATGLPTTAAYDSLVAACETGRRYGDIEQASLDPALDDITPSDLVDGTVHPKPLVQPETAWTYMTEGLSTAQLEIAVPPAFDDPETGAEMVELYWRALTRDVNFRDYEDDPLVAAAADELDSLDAYNGPGADGTVTPGTVFRGVTPGSTTGPYVSQFLWKDRDLGGGTEDQRIEPQAVDETASLDPGETVGPLTDFMTTVEDWLKVQKGVVPPTDESLPGNVYSPDRRYIVTGRDMCERVHDDPPYRQLQKAAQVLVFTMNVPLDESLPYTMKPFTKPSPSRRDVDSFTAQTTLPFNDFGPLYVEKKVLEATEHGQKAAWHKKWNVHRRLRPEEYGGRLQAALGGADSEGATLETARDYPIPENLRSSRALQLTRANYGSALLPQAYAEGSPTHPSYPAGHSVVAGAGVTVLKALFDGDYEFPSDQKVVPTPDGKSLETAAEVDGNPMDIEDTLTVRGELNKLASNMALGRNRAGIHYRTDGIEGLRLGEAAALNFLEDQLTLPRRVAELTDSELALGLETFDGEQRTVRPTV